MSEELPIRSKVAMADLIKKIIETLHEGDRSAALPFIEDLKARSIFLDEQIQQDVLAFVNQILFQYDYDPYHKITPEIQQAANQLIEDMGFQAP